MREGSEGWPPDSFNSVKQLYMNKKKFFVGSVLGVLAMSAAVAGSSLTASADMGSQAQRHLGINQEKRAERVQERVAIRAAVESGDYNAWKKAMGDRPNANEVTESEFPKLQEAHRLSLEGKYQEARQLREEIGMKVFGNGQGRHNQ